MKIGGIEVKGPNEVLLVLPRGDDQIVIRARAVLDMAEFEELCPEPKPPGRQTKDGYVQDVDDPGYKQQMENHNERQLGYLVVKSLEPSEIEWDLVDINKPGSYTKWQEDFQAAGLSTIEVNRIMQACMEANALDESKLEAARQVFLRGQRQVPSESSGPHTEQPSS